MPPRRERRARLSAAVRTRLGAALSAGLLLGCAAEEPAATPPAATESSERAALADPVLPGARGYVAVIAARDATDVSTELSGRVSDIHVQLGDRVDAGQLLATIDDRIAREELAVAQATQRAAQATRDTARVELAEAEGNLERERALAAQGTSAQADLERAGFALDKAKAALARAEAALSEQNARLGQLRARVGSARITAPYAGTVSMRYVDPGTTVAPGTAIVRLIASDDLWVKFAVPSDDAARLVVGQRVRVEVEPVRVAVEAVVRHIAPELEPASQMIVAEAKLDDAVSEIQPDTGTGRVAALKAGQAARVHLLAATKAEAARDDSDSAPQPGQP